jgi:hypothetical protein
MGDDQTSKTQAGAGLPVSHFPKQAIIVIHGMGEQMPMDTIKGFVRAAWETAKGLADEGLPNPTEVWSKPDVRTGSLELRRITTRQSKPVQGVFPTGVRSDFYELYWADLSGGSTWNQVQDWISGLLFRNPRTQVPPNVRLAWIVLWLIALSVVLLLVAAILPDPATVGSINLWEYWPLQWLRGFRGWQLTGATAVLSWIGSSFIVPYFGRVVRYTRAKPDNIAARKNIRDRGMSLLAELHKREYDRIIIVGHSLGSILAYDLISYFWANCPDARVIGEGTGAFAALREVETALDDGSVAAYRAAQTKLARILRTRPKPRGNEPDRRWLITDFITLGSPLSHAEFLMAANKDDLQKRKDDREYPTSPPLREVLDPKAVKAAEEAGFPKGTMELVAFPFGEKSWQLHHAAPFAAVRWTNIFDPARFVAFGDLISGPVAPVFGEGIVDVDLKKLRGQSWHFTHTEYWKLPSDPDEIPPSHIEQLRNALNLIAQDRPL